MQEHRCAYANFRVPRFKFEYITGPGRVIGRFVGYSTVFQKKHHQNLFGTHYMTVGQINQNLILKIFSHIHIGLVFCFFLREATKLVVRIGMNSSDFVRILTDYVPRFYKHWSWVITALQVNVVIIIIQNWENRYIEIIFTRRLQRRL